MNASQLVVMASSHLMKNATMQITMILTTAVLTTARSCLIQIVFLIAIEKVYAMFVGTTKQKS